MKSRFQLGLVYAVALAFLPNVMSAADVVAKTVIDVPSDETKQAGVLATTDGPFLKTGSGILELDQNSTFACDFMVSEGTLRCTKRGAAIGKGYSSLGDTTSSHTIYVVEGATIEYPGSDVQGQFYNDSKIAMHIRGGTFKQAENAVNGFGPIVFDDAVLSYSGSDYSGWPTFGFSEVTFMGTKPYVLENKRSSRDAKFFFGANRMGVLCVSNIVSDAAGSVDRTTPDVTIQALLVDSPNDWTKDGVTYPARPCQFRKTGAGVLRIDVNNLTFTGDVEIAEGVLAFRKRGASGAESGQSSALGDLASGKTVTVCDSGELYFESSDMFGQACSDFDSTLVVSNGTLRFAPGTVNGLPALRLYNPNFVYGVGVGNSSTEDAKSWGLLALRYPVLFDGTKPVEWPSQGVNNILSLGYSSDTAFTVVDGVTNYTGRTEFRVADITKDACVDVNIGLDVQSLPHWKNSSKFAQCRWRCGLLKTGAGTLELSGRLTCPLPTRIAEGALVFDGVVAEQLDGWEKSEMVVERGAYLGGTGTVENVTVQSGGGLTVAVGQSAPLQIGGIFRADGPIVINVTGVSDDPIDLKSLNRLPIAKGVGLDSLSYEVRVNGEAMPNVVARVDAKGVLRVRCIRGLAIILR